MKHAQPLVCSRVVSGHWYLVLLVCWMHVLGIAMYVGTSSSCVGTIVLLLLCSAK